ncbi:hypothetical protein QL285_061089 [Trifolium repens]|jgi:flagellar basal body P-ring protein FlgI|nr:hypothetical protein QL285_061050 [Trifolium repens]KAK2387293.1 hypothetical protein QL285_061089 [Trifolium repens]
MFLIEFYELQVTKKVIISNMLHYEETLRKVVVDNPTCTPLVQVSVLLSNDDYATVQRMVNTINSEVDTRVALELDETRVHPKKKGVNRAILTELGA